MKRTAFLGMVVFLVCAGAGAKQQSNLFVAPNEWELMPGPDSGVTTFLTAAKKEDALLVIVRPVKAGGQSAAQWAKDEVAAIEKQGFELLEPPSERSIGNTAFVRMASRKQLEGFALRNEQYFCAHPDKERLLEVAILGPEPFFEGERGRLETFLSSFDPA